MEHQIPKLTRPRGMNRDQLVAQGMPWVERALGRITAKMLAQADLRSDLRQAGYVGLIAAADNYDPTRGVAFKSFAFLGIRGAMVDELRKLTPRRQWAAGVRTHCVNPSELEWLVVAEDTDPEEACLATQVRAAVDRLPERERALVVGHDLDGQRLDAVAGELGISNSWATRVRQRALAYMADELGVGLS